MSERGKFVTLEGGEGVGKSTQARALAEALKQQGIDALVTREPGGSAGAEAIRSLILHGGADRWDARAEALLFAAARADHIDKTVRPALEAGRWVISDRFVDSSLAYQGGAGGLGIETVRAINAFAIGDCFPDRTLVMVVDQGGERARARDNGVDDRIGGRPAEFHGKVAAAFRLIAAEEPGRVRLVDASGNVDDVTRRLLDAIADLLP